MTMNIDEYRKEHPIKAAQPRLDVTAELKSIAQEFVKLEALTGDPDWDYFLRYIQAALSASTKHQEFEEKVLLNPLQVNTEEIMKAKIKTAILFGRVEALKEVLALPKMLKDGAETARRKIAEMEKDAA